VFEDIEAKVVDAVLDEVGGRQVAFWLNWSGS